MRPGEALVEPPRGGLLPLVLEMCHPPPAEEEQRPLAHARVRDPLAGERAEPDVLLHGPTRYWPERAMARRWPVAAKPTGRRQRTMPSCSRAMPTASRSGRCGTATPGPWRRSSTASARPRGFDGSAVPSRDSRTASSPRSRVSTPTTMCWSASSTETRDPVGLARLVREGPSAEIAFEVADAYQGHGIGRALAAALAADARAAGVRELTATVCGDNPLAVSLLRSIAHSLRASRQGHEQSFVVALRG